MAVGGGWWVRAPLLSLQLPLEGACKAWLQWQLSCRANPSRNLQQKEMVRSLNGRFILFGRPAPMSKSQYD
jgi:hypothetical protein